MSRGCSFVVRLCEKFYITGRGIGMKEREIYNEAGCTAQLAVVYWEDVR